MPRHDTDSYSGAEPIRDRLERAMLIACGESGYRKVTVSELLERCRCEPDLFYRLYDDKEHCYARAHAAEVARLLPRTIGATDEGDRWRDCLRRTLRELARFVSEDPLLAKGLLVEVQVAGGAALSSHGTAIQQLAEAVDSARRETGAERPPPPLTAEFIVGAVESSLVLSLAVGEPERFAAAVPELGRLAVVPYFGDAAGREFQLELER